jgi:formamidopyrimidine-DNA glycosylase
MFEMPEVALISSQLARTVARKRIAHAQLGNSPHKFVWYNRTPEEFERLAAGKVAGKAYSRGKWLFIPLDPGYLLVLGELGGKVLFHESEAGIPSKYHLLVVFDDGSALSAMTRMWGAMELYEKGRELERQYIKDMRPTPAEDGFTAGYFSDLVQECIKTGARSVKGLLTQDQLIPGLGNAIAQDIMFAARLHPKRPIADLGARERKALFNAIRSVVAKATAAGGRNDEVDLFGKPGGYRRVLHSGAAGKPCPACGTKIRKIQYLGGACYFCPTCQI